MAAEVAAPALPRKLRYAFMLQVAMATAAVLLGAYLSSLLTLRILGERSLHAEAAYFWRERARDPAQMPPDTLLLHGYFTPAGGSPDGLPAYLRPLRPGLHDLRAAQALVLVDRQPAGTLYISYRRPSLERIVLWTAAIPALIAMLAIAFTSWLTYRGAHRLVQPLAWLAAQVRRWDPNDADSTRIDLEKLPEDAVLEARQLAGALQQMGRRLREFVRRERHFTRDASHELRTPLTVIRVATDLIEGDPELPPRVQRSLKRIRNASNDMEAVIDAFLILARDESIAPPRETFDVHDVVHHEIDKIRPMLEHRPIELELVEHAHPRLHASPRVLGVMLGNLLHNAATFTERGHIRVEVESDGIRVSDTGIGMSADILAQAADPFYRADIARPDAKGMGLTIVRQLGERFGWPVTIDSQPGHGTTVRIRFVPH